MVIKAWGTRWPRMKARTKDQRLKMFLPFNRARFPPIRQWKLDRLLVHQMISPFLLSHRRYHPVLFDRCSNKIVNLPFPRALSFIFSFKTSMSKSFYIWSHFVYDVLFLYLIKRVAPFTLWISSSSTIIISWSEVLLAFPPVGLRIDAIDNNEKLSP